MLFTIAKLLWLLSWTTAIDISQEIPNDSNKACPQQPSCDSEADDKDLEMSRNCLCEDRCVPFGECCADPAHFEDLTQQQRAGRYSCIRIEDWTGMYVTARCPATWKDLRVRDACETPGDISRNGMLNNPVTSRSTGLAYRNRFCAVCNGDTADLAMWDTRLDCENLIEVSESSRLAVLDTLRYDDGNWTVEYENVTFGCQFTIVPDKSIDVRPCLPETVASCHSEWPYDEIRFGCENSTKAILYNEGRLYKNNDCALCNRVTEESLTCEKSEVFFKFNSFSFAPRSFTSLLLAQPNHRKCSSSHVFYDYLKKTCRPTSPVDNGVPLLNCSRLVTYQTVSFDWRPSSRIEQVTLDNGTTVLCVNTTDTIEQPWAAEAFNSTVLTYVGLSVSAVFLIVHLIVFFALPKMKNLPGKNLASLCASLLCSYTTFVVGNWLTGTACYVGAVLTYYTFLASFAWMSITSFDCWRTIRLATVKLRLNKGHQSKRFLVYSAVGWLVPVVLTSVATATDLIPAVPNRVRPRFGADQCWFGNEMALMLFFVGPIAVVMFVNSALFVWTAYMIHCSQVNVTAVLSEHARRDFRMYLRMFVLMGLTWTTGVIASYVDNQYLWILFVALNTFQGLFLFLAFTFRRWVFGSLLTGGNNNNHVDRCPGMNPMGDNNKSIVGT